MEPLDQKSIYFSNLLRIYSTINDSMQDSTKNLNWDTFIWLVAKDSHLKNSGGDIKNSIGIFNPLMSGGN